MSTHSRESAPLLGGDPPLHAFPNTPHPTPQNVSFRLRLKIAAAMYSFATLGLFNSSIGVLLPLISTYYHLSDLHVSLIFVTGPVAYIIAAQMSSLVHHHFGQFGIALLGPVLQIVAAILLSFHPHFGLVLMGFAVQGLGAGLLDGSWCAWAGSMEKSSTMSGFLHGGYSVGAAAAPLLITFMTTNGHAWFTWYYVLVALSIVDAVVLSAAFWNESAAVYRQTHQSGESEDKAHTRASLKFPATWWCAAYFLGYVGIETAISGWVVSFMLRSRSATPYLAGLSSSGFWAGMAIGRLVLGPVTDRIGVRKATALYLAIAVLVEILFAVLPYTSLSVVLMVFLGFLMGPSFPSGVIVLTQLLPSEVHVAAVSFVASLGQIGGALLPFCIGAVVEGLGIGIFRYAILVQSILAILLWIALSRLRPAAGSFERILARDD